MRQKIRRFVIHSGVHSPGASLGLLILRVGLGCMMAFFHGLPKLQKFPELSAKFADPLGVGPFLSLSLVVFAEFFCALALALGLATRFVVMPLIITMLVAAFIVHADDPWSKKEFALLYALPFVALFFTGAGKYSLDASIKT